MDNTHETKHIDEGCQRRDDETIPSSVRLIQQRIDSVGRQARYCDIGHITEGKLVISAIASLKIPFNNKSGAVLLLRLLLVLGEDMLICALEHMSEMHPA